MNFQTHLFSDLCYRFMSMLWATCSSKLSQFPIFILETAFFVVGPGSWLKRDWRGTVFAPTFHRSYWGTLRQHNKNISTPRNAPHPSVDSIIVFPQQHPIVAHFSDPRDFANNS